MVKMSSLLSLVAMIKVQQVGATLSEMGIRMKWRDIIRIVFTIFLMLRAPDWWLHHFFIGLLCSIPIVQ